MGVFAALGGFYATTWISAEIYCSQGLRSEATLEGSLRKLEIATRLFPLDHDIRRAAASGMIILDERAPPRLALAIVERALADDPYAADLLTKLVGLKMQVGDATGAAKAFIRLARIVPNAPQVRAVLAN